MDWLLDQGRIQDLERGGGSIIGLQAKKGGPGGGPTFGPMLKSLQRGQKGDGPPPPRIRSCILYMGWLSHSSLGLGMLNAFDVLFIGLIAPKENLPHFFHQISEIYVRRARKRNYQVGQVGIK